MIKWCKSCVLPNTRPNLKIGVDGHRVDAHKDTPNYVSSF